MKFVAMAASIALLAVVSGCTEQSSPGGPGVQRQPATRPEARSTTTTANKPVEDVVVNKDQTFRLNLPKSETFDRGKKEDITISISRGKDFTQPVKLEFKTPNGLTVTPAMPMIQSGQDKIKVTVEAANDAPREKTNMTVNAIPQTGEMVSMQMPVEIK